MTNAKSFDIPNISSPGGGGADRLLEKRREKR